MASDNSETFKAALKELETTRDVDTFVTMFSNDAELSSPAREKSAIGQPGAKAFWSDYLDAFETVESTFHHTHTAGDTAALEWESKGKLKKGTAIKYAGVSIVTFTGDKVSRFVTYYDSAAFLSGGSRHVNG